MRSARNPALVFMNAMGDHLLNLPAVRALSEMFGGNLQFVCRPGARATFFPSLQFRRVCEPPTFCANLQYCFDPAPVASELKPIDLLLCLNPARSDAMDGLLSLLAPPSSVGFDAAYRVALPLDFSKHNADLAFDLVRFLDASLQIEDFASPPDLSPQALNFAAEIRRLLPCHAPLLVIHADTKAEKMWPAARFRGLLESLFARVSNLFVLDIGLGNLGLDRISNSDRVIHCGHAPLASQIALVGIADLFVGVDSCFLHAADLFRVPGIGLFGPTSPHEFGFRFGPHRHVVGGPAMEDLLEESVLAAIESLHDETRCLTGLRISGRRPQPHRARNGGEAVIPQGGDARLKVAPLIASQTQLVPGRATADGTSSYMTRIVDAVPSHFRESFENLRLSSIGIGTAGVRGARGTPLYDRASQALEFALRSGVNVIDTASNYGWQEAERMVGQVLRSLINDGSIRREEVIVCSKAGYLAGQSDAERKRLLDGRLCSEGDIVDEGHCLAPAFIEDQILQSRENLGLGSIDVYFLHNAEEQLLARQRDDAYRHISRALVALEEATERGWITCYGFASAEGFRCPGPVFHPLDDLLRLASDVAGQNHHFKVVELPLNLLMTEALFDRNQTVDGKTTTFLEIAQMRGLAVMASTPLGSGRKLPIPAALRRVCPQFWTDTQIALQFVRSNTRICTALVGMTSQDHVEENLLLRQEPTIDLTAPVPEDD
jgi:aryl-alcohol dehydrogenase-like predicted oxidoreductase/ADP-heptose:LPS heptosyltransferase